MDFVTIDVETANADMASICQVGIAKYSAGALIDEWTSVVDPQDYFDLINIGIHGIDESTVEGAPTFPEVAPQISNYLQDSIVACHTHFDRVSISKAFSKHKLDSVSTVWLDTAKVARRAWPEFARRGYGLKNVCEKIGYTFNHHDALEDAKAAGAILLEAIEITNLDLSAWQKRVRQPINPINSSKESGIKREGNPEGELFGEVIVFTGSLDIPRMEAAYLAATIGCNVATGVTKKTTLLVVGDQDVARLTVENKSSKHLKAEKLIEAGQTIRIIKESDFKEMTAYVV